MSTRTNGQDTQTWPELAIGLYDKLTGRGAEITYELNNLQVRVPSRAGEAADFASWALDGTIRVRTRDER